MGKRDLKQEAVLVAPALRDVIATLDGIYNFRRTCLLNELYYGRRLRQFNSASYWLDIIIVVGSGASGISGWYLWTLYPDSKFVWGVIAAIATLLAALKPVLHLEKKAQHYTKLFSGYRFLSASMGDIQQTIREARGISQSIYREVARLKSRYESLLPEDDPVPNSKRVLALQEEVERRIPVSGFWYPEISQAASAKTEVGSTLANIAESLDNRVDPEKPWSDNHEA